MTAHARQVSANGWTVVLALDDKVIGAVTFSGEHFVPSRGGQRGLPCRKLQTAVRMVELLYEEGVEKA